MICDPMILEHDLDNERNQINWKLRSSPMDDDERSDEDEDQLYRNE
jgi:hypothetical protein